MMDRTVRTTVLLIGLSLIAGCSMFNQYGIGISSEDESAPAASQSQRETYVRVWLDGNPAEPGDVHCKIANTISPGPKLKYEITQPEKMGRVKSVMINIFREFDGGWSSNTDFIVIASDTNNPDAQMKPNVVHDLGAPGPEVRIMDGSGNSLEGLRLESGMKYLMNFVVSADRSETVQVVFTAR